MNKSILFILVLQSIIISCASSKVSTREIMDSWLGQTKQELLMSWGPPTRSSSDGAGGEIVIYARQVYMPPQTRTFHTAYSSTTSTSPAVNYWDYRMFWVNKNGIIYHWMTQREQIPPQQLNLDIYIRK